jgi:hypothetical protein
MFQFECRLACNRLVDALPDLLAVFFENVGVEPVAGRLTKVVQKPSAENAGEKLCHGSGGMILLRAA